MNGTDNDRTTGRPDDMSDPLAELFRHASVRQRPPVGDEEAVRQALHEQWQAMTRRPRSRGKIWPWAVAASVAVAAVIGIQLRQDSAPALPLQQVAFADRVIGQITLHTAAGSLVFQRMPDQPLLSGQTIELGSGSKLAMRWNNGAAIRMDERTELKLVSSSELFLVRGRIYTDTASADPAVTGITLRTPQGVVQHLGTQFMTHVSQAGTFVSVREGEVSYFPSVDREDERMLAVKGQQLSVAASGNVVIDPIKTWGGDWDWAEQIAPGIESDGRTLADLLAWAGRESGRRVQYSSANAESIAAATILRGGMELQPMQVLAVATATSDLRADVDEGLIIVQLQSPD